MILHDNQPPPHSNTGAQNTIKKLTALIDWLSFTVPDGIDPFDVLKIKQEEFTLMPHGNFGYLKQEKFGNINVFTLGREDMGSHISLTGQGCREFEQLIEGKWTDFFKKIVKICANITRLDIALDDKVGFVNLKLIEEKVNRAECVSCFKKARVFSDVELSSGDSVGKTIYLGSGQSKLQIRIYDKGAEQRADGHWVRIEIQCRDQRAKVLVHFLAEGIEIGEAVCGVLSNYVRFVEPQEDSNKSRWPTSPWWQEIIGEAERLKLSIEKPIQTIEQKKDWVERQISPTLATIMKSEDGDMSWFYGMISYGAKRMKQKHYNLLRDQK